MSQANVEIVRRGWELWISGDLDGLIALFDPEYEAGVEHYLDAGRDRVGLIVRMEAWTDRQEALEAVGVRA